MDLEFLKRLQLVHSEDVWVLLDSQTLSFSEISSAMGELLKELKEGPDLDRIQKEYELAEEELNGLLTRLHASLEKGEGQIEKPPESNQVPSTVYLNVSNDCNLRCVYCYANYGEYNSAEAGDMTLETAKSAIDRFLGNEKRLGTVVFFGGEPMMEASLIAKACEYVIQECETKSLGKPRFSVITNGLLLHQKNVQMMEKYGFSATVSIDGTEKINDLLRPKPSGKGSHSDIVDGLHRLREVGIIPNIEATYTARHLEMGITPKWLLEYFRDEFSVRTITVAPVSSGTNDERKLGLPHSSVLQGYREAVQFSMETLTSSRPILLFQVGQVLRPLLRRYPKPSDKFCYTYLGRDLFSVSSTGSVYPCQMLNDKEAFNMGAVVDEALHQGEAFSAVQDKFLSMNKENLQCRNCWARTLCFMCLAGVEIETGSLTPIPKHRCDFIKGIIEEVVLQVSQIQKDEGRWKVLNENLWNI